MSENSQDLIGWLDKWQIDSNCRRVFLSLNFEEQRKIRELGGLKSLVYANKILMGRIRAIHGHVKNLIPRSLIENLEETGKKRIRANHVVIQIPNRHAENLKETGKKRIRTDPKRHAKNLEETGKKRVRANHGLSQIPKRHAKNLEETGKKGDTLECKKYKGEGKGGSLGIPVEERACQLPCSTAGVAPTLTYPTNRVRKYSSQEIEYLIDGGYYSKAEFARSIYDLQPGDNVLWQGVKTGRNGGESTKEFYFHGVFHRWVDWNHASVS